MVWTCFLKDASTRQHHDLGGLRLQKHQRSGLSCPRVWHHCWYERRQVRVSIIWVNKPPKDEGLWEPFQIGPYKGWGVIRSPLTSLGAGVSQIFLEFSSLKLGKMNPIWHIIFFQPGWFNHQLVILRAPAATSPQNAPALMKGQWMVGLHNPFKGLAILWCLALAAGSDHPRTDGYVVKQTMVIGFVPKTWGYGTPSNWPNFMAVINRGYLLSTYVRPGMILKSGNLQVPSKCGCLFPSCWWVDFPKIHGCDAVWMIFFDFFLVAEIFYHLFIGVFNTLRKTKIVPEKMCLGDDPFLLGRGPAYFQGLLL